MFDWIPNLHPIIVHFPIALVVAAVVVDLVVLIFKRDADTAVSWLYVTGTLGLVAAFFSGRAAADALLIPAAAQTIQTDHADLALATLSLFTALTIVRLVLMRLGRPGKSTVRILSTVAGLVGVGLVTLTGDLGGRMVFGHGVGVATPAPIATSEDSNATSVGSENPGAVLGYALNTVSGDFSRAVLAADSTVLTLHLDRNELVLVTDETYGSVQVEIEMNVDRFKGRASALYNFVSADQTDYIEFGRGTVEQGRVSEGSSNSFDSAVMTPGGWFTLTVVSDGSHFRGYVDGTLIVHGHDDPAPEGAIGFGLDGSGVVQVRRLDVQPLR